MRFLILGGRGFVGSSISAKLIECGHECFTKGRKEVDFTETHFDVLIDATSQSNSELSSYVEDLEKIVSDYNISRVVILSSFSTLQSELKNDLDVCFGSKLFGFTPYTIVKYRKEKKISQSPILSKRDIRFIYLPIIFGNGGIWETIKKDISENTVVPQVNNIFYISKDNIALAILALLKSKLRRATAFEQPCSGFTKLFNKKLNSISEEDFNKSIFVRIIKKLQVYNNVLFSTLTYVLSTLILKVKYKKYCPSFFYWTLFYSQSKNINSLSDFNVLDRGRDD